MFDPYHQWLAIPPTQRPPTLYQLLGVAPDETESSVIEEAALRQTAHVRTYQTGPYSEQCTKLLNEIGQARATLLNADKRREYDARLQPAGGAIPLAMPVAQSPPPALPVPRSERPFPRGALLPALGYGAILMLGGVLVFRLAPVGSRTQASQGLAANASEAAALDPPSGTERARGPSGVRLLGHESAVNALGLSPDGQFVFSAGGGYSAGTEGEAVGCVPRRWNLRTQKILQLYEGHLTPIATLSLSPDGGRFLTGSGGYEWRAGTLVPIDCTVRLWDAAEGREVLVFTNHAAPVRGVAFHPDGNQVVSCDCDGAVFSWNLRGNSEPRRLPGKPFPAVCLAVSPEGRHALAGGSDGSLHLWDLQTALEVVRFPRGDSPVHAVAFSTDGRRVAVGSGKLEYRRDRIAGKDCIVRIWELSSGKVLHTLDGHTRPVRAVAFGRGGRWLASGGLDGAVWVWDEKTGKPLHRCEGPTSAITSLAVRPERAEVLAGTLGGSVWQWRLPEKTSQGRSDP